MTAYRRNGAGALLAAFRVRRVRRGAAWGGIILGALIAFEIFNFGTTQFALLDVLGELKFAGIRWATILAIAFCGIDFAGIARIFTPEQGRDEPAEVWYLFGAWLLAAVFNATLTWWGVSVAILNHTSANGDAVIGAQTMTRVVPVFVAAMILLIRVMLIQTFSIAGDRLFTTDERHTVGNPIRSTQQQSYRPASSPVLRPASTINRPVAGNAYRPVPKPAHQQTSFMPPEPTYHNLSFNGQMEGERSYDA
ncbi:MAG: hypothetical protein HXY42_15120 [Chloroflexi bacterium]|nr:hypothetical protein [Chloroflexota bacterium]